MGGARRIRQHGRPFGQVPCCHAAITRMGMD